MEQQYGAPSAALAQAARTVLPGEPFEAPSQSHVPGPRPAEQLQAPVAPVGYPTGPGAGYGAPYPTAPAQQQMQQPMPPTQPIPSIPPIPPASNGSSAYETLQEYAMLPVADEFAAAPGYPEAAAYPQTAGYPPAPGYPQAPAPAAPWAPAAAVPTQFGAPAYPTAPPRQDEPLAYPPLPPFALQLPTLLPEAIDEEESSGRGRRRASRSGPNRSLLALAAVVALAGGGYYGYTQHWFGNSSTAATPAAAAPVATPHRYQFPASLAHVDLQQGRAAAAQLQRVRGSAVRAYPTFAKTVSVASYGLDRPAIVAETFRPAASQLPTAYSALLADVRKPSKGNVAEAFTSAAPGAAGGQMTCGGQRGASPMSYCVWRGTAAVGVLSISGTSDTENTQALTRELRAYAEH